MEQWRRQCEAVKKRKVDAVAAKNQAELDCNNARTQQEAKSAEMRLGDAVEKLKVVLLSCTCLSLDVGCKGVEIAEGTIQTVG